MIQAERELYARRQGCHFSGVIIEQYPDDFPFPSCLVLGTTTHDRTLHVVISDEGYSSRIITTYYPDPEQWSGDFKARL